MFCNILSYLLYCSSDSKDGLAFRVEAITLHCLKPFLCQFFESIPILDLRIPLLKLPPPLGCWSVMSAGNEAWIGTSNDLSELGPHYMLAVVSLGFNQVSGVYSQVIKVGWGLMLSCCRRTCFLLMNARYFCHTVVYICSSCFGGQVGIDCSTIQNELIVN